MKKVFDLSGWMLIMCILFLTSCNLAPAKDSHDMFIALAFCYAPVLLFLYFAYRASKSGSMVKKQLWYRDGFKWVSDTGNIKIWQSGWIPFAITWLLLGSIFFWAILWPDHHDVWFVQ